MIRFLFAPYLAEMRTVRENSAIIPQVGKEIMKAGFNIFRQFLRLLFRLSGNPSVPSHERNIPKFWDNINGFFKGGLWLATF
jgi:hypothetical protein